MGTRGDCQPGERTFRTTPVTGRQGGAIYYGSQEGIRISKQRTQLGTPEQGSREPTRELLWSGERGVVVVPMVEPEAPIVPVGLTTCLRTLCTR